MIEVFKTNVRTKKQAGKVYEQLTSQYPTARINFDLSDCDRVLRVEGNAIEARKIMVLVKEYGFMCEELD